MSRNAQNLQEKANVTQEETSCQYENADYFIFGKMDTFSRPPVTDFAQENLFYMEAFSIFTCPRGVLLQTERIISPFLSFTYEGNGALEYMGKRSYSLGPGDGFFIDCRVPHLTARRGCLEAWRIPLERPLVPALFSRYMENGSVSFYQPFYRQLSKEAGGTVIHLWLRYSPAGTGWLPIVSAVSLPSSQERVRGKKQTPRYRKICVI